MFSMKVCECQEEHGCTLKNDAFIIKHSSGELEILPKGIPGEYSLHVFGFCRKCKKPYLSKEKAKEFVRRAVEKKQKTLGFLTGEEVRELRDQTGMSVRTFGEFLKIHYATISGIENGNIIQTKTADQVIRTKTKEYITRNAPERKKLKKVFAYMIQTVGTSKLFLNKMMFYVDFWHFKKTDISLTGSNYTPLQYGPCPVGYQDILQEMIEDGEITPIGGHCFRVNKTPDMSEFSPEKMQSINDIVALAKNDKGKKLFDLSHEEKGFIETPLYEMIPYEYAKDLKIEELLNEIAETG